jgi:hypothetical protein
VCLLLGEPEAAPAPFDCGVPRRRRPRRRPKNDSGADGGDGAAGEDDDDDDEDSAGGNRAGRPDHAALAAALRTLDVAIDAGFAALPSPGSPSSGKDATATAATAHDAAADAVAAAVDALRSRVLSGLAGAGGGAAGPAHLARLTADAVAERLANRVRMGVRTRAPPARDLYDGDGAGKEEGERAVMEKWVVRARKAKEKKQPVEDPGTESGEDEDMDESEHDGSS